MRKQLARLLMWIAAVAMVSGCAMSPAKRNGMLVGAGVGGLIGGGMGCGIAALQDDGTEAEAYEIGCPVGVGVGAIVGGTIGYLMAQEPLSPPPPPPPPPTTSTTSPTTPGAGTDHSARRAFRFQQVQHPSRRDTDS